MNEQMNKQQILEQIDELKQKIEELEKEVNSSDFERIKNNVRFRADYGKPYFFINNEGAVSRGIEQYRPLDDFRYNSGNYFETEEQTKDFRENVLTKQALKDLALELNNGVKIDWDNDNQNKFQIYFDYCTSRLSQCWGTQSPDFNIYCLNPDFICIAKNRIGEEKLIKLINSGL